jgi:hypothetical protein
MANTEESDKRLVEAADSVITAAEALVEAKNGLADTRFGSEREQDRMQAFQGALKASENAVKRMEEALRKSLIAAALRQTPGAFEGYRAIVGHVFTARNELKAAPNADGMAAKQQKLQATVGAVDAAMNVIQGLVFA